MGWTRTTTPAPMPNISKIPPCPPRPKPTITPIMAAVVEHMKDAAEVLSTWNGIYAKERALDKIRIAETYIAMAKEKLEKL